MNCSSVARPLFIAHSSFEGRSRSNASRGVNSDESCRASGRVDVGTQSAEIGGQERPNSGQFRSTWAELAPEFHKLGRRSLAVEQFGQSRWPDSVRRYFVEIGRRSEIGHMWPCVRHDLIVFGHFRAGGRACGPLHMPSLGAKFERSRPNFGPLNGLVPISAELRPDSRTYGEFGPCGAAERYNYSGMLI